jgi:sugar transferase (PEP-CTERM/EpsH1 system associated)
MSAKEILFLAHRIPYPPDKGDKIRSWRLFEHLAKRFRVHLGCFIDDPDDARHMDRLSAMSASAAFIPLTPTRAKLRAGAALLSSKPFSFAYFADARMREYVTKCRARPLALEFAFSSGMAPYIERAAASSRIVDFCDADSEKWRDYGVRSAQPMRRLFAREAERLTAAETRILNWADAAFAVSDAEAATLNSRPGAVRRATVVRNGVDTAYFAPREADANSPEAVFVGAMDYRANIDAILWFVREVWPLVRAESPDARLAIVGARPVASIRRLNGRAGVIVAGRVQDVRPYLASAAAVVAPLRIARGIQNKVLEAMAMARPVVATGAANAGVNASPGREILIADAPPAFAAEIVGLFNDRSRGERIGAAARARVRADFQWDLQLQLLDAALSRLRVI